MTADTAAERNREHSRKEPNMLRSIKSLFGYKLAAKDGTIGKVKDFLFDQPHWTVRWMVADTGNWLPERKVLISPVSLGEPRWDSRLFPVRLTQDEIERAPHLDTDAPDRKSTRLNSSHYS